MRRGQVRHPGHEAGLRDKEKVEDRTPSTLGRFSRPRNSTAQRWCVVKENGVARGMGGKGRDWGPWRNGRGKEELQHKGARQMVRHDRTALQSTARHGTARRHGTAQCSTAAEHNPTQVACAQPRSLSPFSLLSLLPFFPSLSLWGVPAGRRAHGRAGAGGGVGEKDRGRGCWRGKRKERASKGEAGMGSRGIGNRERVRERERENAEGGGSEGWGNKSEKHGMNLSGS